MYCAWRIPAHLCSTHTMRPMNADPNSPDVALASVSLITSSEWQTHTTMSTAYLPILIGLQTNVTSSSTRHRTYINIKKADWTGYRQNIERKLSSRHLPTDCQKHETLSRVTLLKDTSIISQLEDVSYTRNKSQWGNPGHDAGARRLTQAGPRLAPAVDNELCEISKATSVHNGRHWRQYGNGNICYD